MGTVYRFLLLFLMLSLFSCGSEDAALSINSFVEFQVPPGLNSLETHYFIENDVPIQLETRTRDAGWQMDDLKSFLAGDATLMPGNGFEFDLGFIRSVNIFLIDPQDITKRHEIFYLDIVQPGAKTEIRLFNNITDLKELIENDKADLEVGLEFYAPPTSTFDFRLNMSFGVYLNE